MALSPKILIKTDITPTFEQMGADASYAGKVTAKFIGRDWMRTQMRRLLGYVKEEAPKRTGKFANAHHFRTYQQGENTFTGRIYGPTPLKGWIVTGTGIYGPHHSPIVPTHAKYLHFYIGGTEFFRRSVKGMKPNK